MRKESVFNDARTSHAVLDEKVEYCTLSISKYLSLFSLFLYKNNKSLETVVVLENEMRPVETIQNLAGGR
jgi:hypothetical protein